LLVDVPLDVKLLIDEEFKGLIGRGVYGKIIEMC